MTLTVKMLKEECWWGGSTAEAHHFPLTEKSVYSYDMRKGLNQTMPLFISNKGRYIFSTAPLTLTVRGGEFTLTSDGKIYFEEVGKTLKDAYLYAMRKHFPFSGKVPPLKFFSTAQYNTWMELDYNQTEEGVLKYARALIENGYEPGVLMIDEGWHTPYGEWEFDLTKFPHPKEMIAELHTLGFTVMLWVVPLVTPCGKDFIIATDPSRKCLSPDDEDKDYFLRTDDGEVALVRWWNGFSAILNMCKECDRKFLDKKLRRLIDEYGVDGFKFDGGNISMYNEDHVVNGRQTAYTPEELNIAWNDFGARYEYHEYKDTYGGGGKAVIQRLRDRNHTWNDYGITSILPAALLEGLIGHPFICPDMVGGGEWSFNYFPDFKCDEELFVRMAQCSALFPMIQFSWAPWRLLDEKHAALCLDAAKLHKEFAPYIKELVKSSAVSGEPILRHLEYEFPGEGFETVDDQFMLGDKILVAPVLEKGATVRTVKLPRGRWDFYGEVFDGARSVTVSAPIERLVYFKKI